MFLEIPVTPFLSILIKTKKALILKSCTKLLIFVKFRSSYLLKKVKQTENTVSKAQIKRTMFRKTNVFWHY